MRPEKESIINEISGDLEQSAFMILTDYRGLKVDDFVVLRDTLRQCGSKMTVVKNGLLNIAAGRAGWEDMSEFLDGPTAMVTGSGDVTVVAKSLRKFIKEKDIPVIKGGHLGDKRLTASDVEAMATLPSREVLLGQLVGTIAAPMTQAVGVLHQKLSSIVYVLKAIEEKKQG
jgi:large subunit ribosomal protein L10